MADYLAHYGRKGMKWGKNIFAKTKVLGDDLDSDRTVAYREHLDRIAGDESHRIDAVSGLAVKNGFDLDKAYADYFRNRSAGLDLGKQLAMQIPMVKRRQQALNETGSWRRHKNDLRNKAFRKMVEEDQSLINRGRKFFNDLLKNLGI